MTEIEQCIICKRQIEHVEREFDMPLHATTFVSHGNYGSGLFDPVSESGYTLRIVMCDPCLADARDRGEVLLVKTTHRPPEVTRRRWTREEQDARL